MKKKLILLLVFMSSFQRLFASDLQVYIDSHETYVGQPLQLTVQISSSKPVERPELQNIPGFQVSPAGESRYEQRTLGNGGGSRTVTMEYSWRLLPLQTGRLTVPSLKLELEDGVFSSAPIEILVREPGPVEGYHLFLTVRDETAFPGIPVRLTLKWLFSSEVSRPEFSLPFLNQDNLDVIDLPPPSAQSSDIYQFSVAGRTVYGVQSAEIFEGEQYASLSMSWDIYPQEEGTLNLESVFLSFQRSLLNKQGRKTYVPAVIPSNELTLKVKELPRKLKDFPGGILVAEDTLDVGVSLDQTRIYPGDPLEMTLTFKGLSSPEISRFKGVSSLKELEGIVRVDKGSLNSTVQDNSKIYTQKIRIETDGIDVFPALNFPYYRLSTGTVETVQSEGIPLTLLSLDGTAADSETPSRGFLNWNKTDNSQDGDPIELKGNHRIRSSVFYRILYTRGMVISLLLFGTTVLLLLIPPLVKAVSSMRFGKAEADIRILLKRAVKAYENHPDIETGQELHRLLIQWKDIRNFSARDFPGYEELTETLEKSLWGNQTQETAQDSHHIKQLINEHLVKHLNKRRRSV